jgi:hypothetical protein
MTIKYAVYNATNGENVLYETKEEALQAFWVNVVKFAKSHFHNSAYMVVQQNEDGSETWFNDNNQEIDKPLSADEIEQILSFVPSDSDINEMVNFADELDQK